MDVLIGDRKYLVGDHMTIADISVLATTQGLLKYGTPDVAEYKNFKRWITGLMSDLKSYKEFADIPEEEMMTFIARMKEAITKMVEQGSN